MSDWLWVPWETVGSVVLGTLAIYVSVLCGVRLAGRRTISQLSAFDAVVTVALGSTMASTALGEDPSYAQGATVTVTLLVLQVALAAIRRRSDLARRMLDFPAETVVRNGEVTLPNGLLSSQLSREELDALLRQKGIFDVSGLRLVLLEPSGSISVAPDADAAGSAATGRTVDL